jgi:dinuclear metal center YbgI/SA1388 family protein
MECCYFANMQLNEIICFLEDWAPPALQENYDNSGLLVGNSTGEVTGVLFCLDCTEAIVDEAVKKGCNLIVAHHPIVFSGLKRLTGSNYIERTVMSAIKQDVAIYAIHTNLDNVRSGVNAKIAQRLGLTKTSILAPKTGLLLQLQVYVPTSAAEAVREALFSAGAGKIGHYEECSFETQGRGTFKPGPGASPSIGEHDIRHTEPEVCLSVVLPEYLKNTALRAVRSVHPYEEVAHQFTRLENVWQDVGSGMVGDLASPLEFSDFLKLVKANLNAAVVRYTNPVRVQVQRVAICGGSGSFLLEHAKRSKADVYITADYKYHQFFDADGQISIVDIGHFESEQFTIELLGERFRQNFPTFASHLTEIVTNPVHYM